MKAKAIRTVHYKETENAEWQEGFILDDGSGPLVNLDGQEVKECWDYMEASINADVSIEKEVDDLVIRIRPLPPQPIKPKGWDYVDTTVEEAKEG